MEYKTLINVSFPVLMEEFQQHIQEGWIIDEANCPMDNFLQKMIHIVLPDDVPAKKADTPSRAGRPAKVVEK